MVLIEAYKCYIALWMVDQEKTGISKIQPRSVLLIPALLRSAPRAIIARAIRYWKDRANVLSRYKLNGTRGSNLYMALKTPAGLSLCIFKTVSGSVRKRAPRVIAYHDGLHTELGKLRNYEVKFNASLLLALSLHLVSSPKNATYGPNSCDRKLGSSIIMHLNAKWVGRFMTSKFTIPQ